MHSSSQGGGYSRAMKEKSPRKASIYCIIIISPVDRRNAYWIPMMQSIARTVSRKVAAKATSQRSPSGFSPECSSSHFSILFRASGGIG